MKGFQFTVEEPKLNAVDRNINGMALFSLPMGDEVSSIEYTEEYEYKEFYVSLSEKGILRCSNRKNSDPIITITSSSSELLVFTSKGNVHKLKSFMIQNLDKKGINLKELFSDFDEREVVVNIVSVNQYRQNESLYFFTSNGMVKKTSCKEFEGDFISTIGCKLKAEEHRITNVILSQGDVDILLVTKKAMTIRFSGDSVSLMGKNAAGVTAISLKDDDEVIFAMIISAKEPLTSSLEEVSVDKYEGTLRLFTFSGDNKTVEVISIPTQNRAGRGKNIMLFLKDDFIEKVELC